MKANVINHLLNFMTKQEQLDYIEESFPLYKCHQSNRAIRHDFFNDINTELQAYLLGFYAADGSVDEKRKTLRIHLQKQDSELVELYKNVISPDARTFTVEEHFTTGRNKMQVTAHESFGVDITSAILVNDLVDIGFGYNKSKKELHLPNIPKKLIRHFIRGYFDGDGCITGWLAVEKGKTDRVRYSFAICGKTHSLLIDIQLFFAEHGVKINLNYLKRDDMYRIKTSSKECIKNIFSLLYQDSNFYLSRKFNKFSYYANTEVNQLIADHRNA